MKPENNVEMVSAGRYVEISACHTARRSLTISWFPRKAASYNALPSLMETLGSAPRSSRTRTISTSLFDIALEKKVRYGDGRSTDKWAKTRASDQTSQPQHHRKSFHIDGLKKRRAVVPHVIQNLTDSLRIVSHKGFDKLYRQYHFRNGSVLPIDSAENPC